MNPFLILYQKELRSLTGYLWVCLVVAGIDIFDQFYQSPLGSSSFVFLFKAEAEPSDIGVAVILLLLGIAMASGSFNKEFDEGTSLFLKSLPIHGAKIFHAKYLALFSIVILYIILGYLRYLFFQFFALNSLNNSMYLADLGKAFLIDVFQVFILISASCFFSLFRKAGWMLCALLFIGYSALIANYPIVEKANILQLMERVEKTNLEKIVSDSGFWIKIAIGVFFYLSSLMIYLFLFHRNYQKQVHFSNKKFRIGSIISIVVTLTAWIVVIVLSNGEEEGGGLKAVEENFVIEKKLFHFTENFVFLYHESQKEKVLPMITEAEEVYQQIANFFLVEVEGNILIKFHLNSPNFVGIAHWKEMNLDLNKLQDLDEFQSTFAHELTHIFIEIISEGNASSHFNSIRFFHEGFAQYMEEELFPDAEKRRKEDMHQTALMWKKGVDFSIISDSRVLSEKWDSFLVYPMGKEFVRSLIAVHGKEAPKRLLKALLRKSTSFKVEGEQFWQALFQGAGLSFFPVLDHYESRMKAISDQYPELHQSFDAYIDLTEEGVQITPTAVPKGWRLLCRIKKNRNSTYQQYLDGVASGETCNINNRSMVKSSFWVQLIFEHQKTGIEVYESWREFSP